MTELSLFWFRQDLRLHDNPGLFDAALKGTVVLVYIHDTNPTLHSKGSASQWWLHHSLDALQKQCQGKLNIYSGDPQSIIEDIAQRFNITNVYWNRCYEPDRIQQDKTIKQVLKEKGVQAKSFNASLLWEPMDVLKSDGTPYKVFTPFYRRGCLQTKSPRPPLALPAHLNALKDEMSIDLSALQLLPTIPWDKEMNQTWKPSEASAMQRFHNFLDDGLNNYKEGRNFPIKNNVSRLSPHLHFGEISPHQIWHKLEELKTQHTHNMHDIDHFQSEMGWREFSYYLLFHFPTLPFANFQKKFDAFQWQHNQTLLSAWQKGLTGYPIVDAGMRELWRTGYMHNRVRMIVGSFLVKNLLIDWRKGSEWFWDCLIDADLANNSASWQWIAGSGADAAPYFRIFNPITQGEKFDPDGSYTRHYVPELKNLPQKYLFSPWTAPAAVLHQSGITLGTHYPHPIVDISSSRELALNAFASLKNND